MVGQGRNKGERGHCCTGAEFRYQILGAVLMLFVSHPKEQAGVCVIYRMRLEQSNCIYIYIYMWTGISCLKPSGYCMYCQFNIHQFYVLPTQCIYVFCVDLRINSDYLLTQH